MSLSLSLGNFMVFRLVAGFEHFNCLCLGVVVTFLVLGFVEFLGSVG